MADTLPAIKHLVRQTAVGIFAAALERRGANSCPEDPVPRRGPRVGSFLLQALNEIRMQPQEQQTARSIVISLLSHCTDLLGSQAQTSSRSQALVRSDPPVYRSPFR